MSAVLLISSLLTGAEQAPSAQLSVVLEWRNGVTSVVTLPEMLGMCNSLLEKPENLDPSTRADVLMRRARARFFLDDDEGAENDLKQAQSLRPDDIEIGWQMANVWMAKPETRDKVLRWGEATLKKDPSSYYGNLRLGGYFFLTGDSRKAIGYYAHALKARPLSSQALFERGATFLRLEQYDDCIKDARAALAAPAENETLANRIHLLYGMALLRQQHFSQAEPFFSQSIRLGNNKVDPHVCLWLSCSKQRKFGACLEVAKRMSIAYPSDVQGRLMLAASMAQFGEPDHALADLTKATPSPGNRDMLESVHGRILVSKRDYREGLVHFQRVLDRKPGLIENTIRAALLCATCPQDDIRDGELAKVYARRCVPLLDGDADHWMAFVVLATAQAECKEFEDAMRTLANAKKAAGENEHCVRACRELEKLFAKGKPYRLDPAASEKAFFEIPIAYYVGGIDFNTR